MVLDAALAGPFLGLVGFLGRGVTLGRVGVVGIGDAVGQFQRRFQAVGQACLQPFADHHAVDHDLDVVLELLVQVRRFVDVVQLAVDADALKPLLREGGDFLFVFALAATHDRGQQVQPRARLHGHDAVDHFRHGLAFDRQARGRRMGDADPREQQAHVIVDFRDRADGGARVARRRLLFDGNGGAEPVDMVDVGLLHQFQELARIGGQAFHIAALALGIDGVEGEGRFS